MQWRDRNGRAVMIDDDRFAPVFRALSARGVVVLGHQGEPRNAWLPLERMTIRGDREYFAAHPQYHMYLHPEWPSYDAQIAARDRWPRPQSATALHRRAPRVARMGRRSGRRFPQAIPGRFGRSRSPSGPPAAPVRDAARQGPQQFFLEYQDRILYGSDLASGPKRTTRSLRATRTKLAGGLALPDGRRSPALG